MLTKMRALFAAVVGSITGLSAYFSDQCIIWVDGVKLYLVGWWQDVMLFLQAQIPPELATNINGTWDGVLDLLVLVDDIAWILPVYEVLTIVLSTYVACAYLRAARWVLACIPLLGL